MASHLALRSYGRVYGTPSARFTRAFASGGHSIGSTRRGPRPGPSSLPTRRPPRPPEPLLPLGVHQQTEETDVPSTAPLPRNARGQTGPNGPRRLTRTQRPRYQCALHPYYSRQLQTVQWLMDRKPPRQLPIPRKEIRGYKRGRVPTFTPPRLGSHHITRTMVRQDEPLFSYLTTMPRILASLPTQRPYEPLSQPDRYRSPRARTALISPEDRRRRESLLARVSEYIVFTESNFETRQLMPFDEAAFWADLETWPVTAPWFNEVLIYALTRAAKRGYVQGVDRVASYLYRLLDQTHTGTPDSAAAGAAPFPPRVPSDRYRLIPALKALLKVYSYRHEIDKMENLLELFIRHDLPIDEVVLSQYLLTLARTKTPRSIVYFLLGLNPYGPKPTVAAVNLWLQSEFLQGPSSYKVLALTHLLASLYPPCDPAGRQLPHRFHLNGQTFSLLAGAATSLAALQGVWLLACRYKVWLPKWDRFDDPTFQLAILHAAFRITGQGGVQSIRYRRDIPAAYYESLQAGHIRPDIFNDERITPNSQELTKMMAPESAGVLHRSGSLGPCRATPATLLLYRRTAPAYRTTWRGLVRRADALAVLDYHSALRSLPDLLRDVGVHYASERIQRWREAEAARLTGEAHWRRSLHAPVTKPLTQPPPDHQNQSDLMRQFKASALTDQPGFSTAPAAGAESSDLLRRFRVSARTKDAGSRAPPVPSPKMTPRLISPQSQTVDPPDEYSDTYYRGLSSSSTSSALVEPRPDHHRLLNHLWKVTLRIAALLTRTRDSNSAPPPSPSLGSGAPGSGAFAHLRGMAAPTLAAVEMFSSAPSPTAAASIRPTTLAPTDQLWDEPGAVPLIAFRAGPSATVPLDPRLVVAYLRTLGTLGSTDDLLATATILINHSHPYPATGWWSNSPVYRPRVFRTLLSTVIRTARASYTLRGRDNDHDGTTASTSLVLDTFRRLYDPYFKHYAALRPFRKSGPRAVPTEVRGRPPVDFSMYEKFPKSGFMRHRHLLRLHRHRFPLPDVTLLPSSLPQHSTALLTWIYHSILEDNRQSKASPIALPSTWLLRALAASDRRPQGEANLADPSALLTTVHRALTWILVEQLPYNAAEMRFALASIGRRVYHSHHRLTGGPIVSGRRLFLADDHDPHSVENRAYSAERDTALACNAWADEIVAVMDTHDDMTFVVEEAAHFLAQRNGSVTTD
ncbi:hypothetical protein IWQ60_004150 [Tieghemiomyces parasiticus]|uniref:Uncharacterized protein n=1 Tax=Tieghemiomyces parasiticus TaxID=78921 RepID=A0A9W8E017_9FUNG|nr:hypothetical protein IWQ60_004150 [Tieghemiomyces parasiticus]